MTIPTPTYLIHRTFNTYFVIVEYVRHVGVDIKNYGPILILLLIIFYIVLHTSPIGDLPLIKNKKIHYRNT